MRTLCLTISLLLAVAGRGQSVTNLVAGQWLTAGTVLAVNSSTNAPAFSASRVQFAHSYSGATSLSGVAAGNLLVVAASAHNLPGSPSLSSSLGNSYTMVTNIGTASYPSGGVVWVCTNSLAGSETVTVSGLGDGDQGINLVEYRGVHSVAAVAAAVDTTTLTNRLSPGSTAIFFGLYFSEIVVQSMTSTLNPGGVSATVINADYSHVDVIYEFLNGGAGYATGSYTNIVSNADNRIGSIVIGLK